MQSMLVKLGVSASFSRPRVSNDNACTEFIIRTLKYAPAFPRNGFMSLEAARAWVQAFSHWYNTEHRHRGINYFTPEQRHEGLDVEILAKRHGPYQAARAENPQRWAGEPRIWERPEQVWLNPERQDPLASRAASRTMGDNYLNRHRGPLLQPIQVGRLQTAILILSWKEQK